MNKITDKLEDWFIPIMLASASFNLSVVVSVVIDIILDDRIGYDRARSPEEWVLVFSPVIVWAAIVLGLATFQAGKQLYRRYRASR